LLISNHNSFRVLFDDTAFAYFICKKYIYMLAVKTASPGNRHCANYIGTLSFPIGSGSYWAERPVHFSSPWAASISGPPSAILNTTHYSVHQCSFTQPLRFNFHWHQNAKCTHYPRWRVHGPCSRPVNTGVQFLFLAPSKSRLAVYVFSLFGPPTFQTLPPLISTAISTQYCARNVPDFLEVSHAKHADKGHRHQAVALRFPL